MWTLSTYTNLFMRGISQVTRTKDNMVYEVTGQHMEATGAHYS
jgi:hypothetical protein